jgi:hypothetical protein
MDGSSSVPAFVRNVDNENVILGNRYRIIDENKFHN